MNNKCPQCGYCPSCGRSNPTVNSPFTHTPLTTSSTTFSFPVSQLKDLKPNSVPPMPGYVKEIFERLQAIEDELDGEE